MIIQVQLRGDKLCSCYDHGSIDNNLYWRLRQSITHIYVCIAEAWRHPADLF